jgi:hypothetical protein
VSLDFEVTASLRAEHLTVHHPPDPVETTGENATIARRGVRQGLPKRMQPDGRYTHVVVEKEVLGSLVEP